MTFHVVSEYAGTVITSLCNASTTTRGNWFQTNQPKHESDDRAGDTVTSVGITNEKRNGTSAANLIIICHCIVVMWCSKTNITDGTWILVLVSVL